MAKIDRKQFIYDAAKAAGKNSTDVGEMLAAEIFALAGVPHEAGHEKFSWVNAKNGLARRLGREEQAVRDEFFRAGYEGTLKASLSDQIKNATVVIDDDGRFVIENITGGG